jgi:hypothetical protein
MSRILNLLCIKLNNLYSNSVHPALCEVDIVVGILLTFI